MKHFRLLFLTVVLCAWSSGAFAQKVSLSVQDVKLEKVLEGITKQTGLVFYYTRPTINPDKRVTVNVKNAEVESVLHELFDKDGITYEIKDKKIYLAAKTAGGSKSSSANTPPPALCGPCARCFRLADRRSQCGGEGHYDRCEHR